MKHNTKPTPLQLAKFCREIALDKKAEDVMILDLRRIAPVADYFLICSGHSEPHLKAIGDEMVRRLRDRGVRARGHHGLPGSRWVVLDFADVLVHIFHPEMRERYALEQLWGDAKRVR